MMTHATAFELSRLRLEEATRRAGLAATLGEVPQPRALFPFRRRVISALPGVVEVRPGKDRERIRRRLMELAAQAPARSERRAS